MIALTFGSMARKLIIVLVNTDPRNGEELGAPFFHAAVAAAMNIEVQVICAATAATSRTPMFAHCGKAYPPI